MSTETEARKRAASRERIAALNEQERKHRSDPKRRTVTLAQVRALMSAIRDECVTYAIYHETFGGKDVPIDADHIDYHNWSVAHGRVRDVVSDITGFDPDRID